jgi:hypothetical protein
MGRGAYQKKKKKIRVQTRSITMKDEVTDIRQLVVMKSVKLGRASWLKGLSQHFKNTLPASLLSFKKPMYTDR